MLIFFVLFLLNGVTYVEASRKLGEHMMTAGDTPEAWIHWGRKAATAREPEDQEVQVLLAGYASRLKYFTEHPEEATSLQSTGEAPTNDKFTPTSSTASAILNLDKAIMK